MILKQEPWSKPSEIPSQIPQDYEDEDEPIIVKIQIDKDGVIILDDQITHFNIFEDVDCIENSFGIKFKLHDKEDELARIENDI